MQDHAGYNATDIGHKICPTLRRYFMLYPSPSSTSPRYSLTLVSYIAYLINALSAGPSVVTRMRRSSKFLARHIHASRKPSAEPAGMQILSDISRVASAARAKLDAMDQVSKDHNICVDRATTLTLTPDPPESVKTQEIELNFRNRAEDVTAP
ncbi:hypothetical protein F4825DRAFT_448898 [Nemania diffusa]|nr:hypothetical protein F4825DRAFT_448898 [Nemania diffusa]